MQIELDIPVGLIKKIKALSILDDGDTGNIEGTLVALIDETVSKKIAEAVGIVGRAIPLPAAAVEEVQARPTIVRPTLPRMSASDVTGISEGLGDTDDDLLEDHAVLNPEDLIPDAVSSGGLTDEMIASDLDFDEGAAGSAVPHLAHEVDPSGIKTDALFADTVGIPHPAVIEEAPHVQRRSQRRTRGKGKVTPYGGG